MNSPGSPGGGWILEGRWSGEYEYAVVPGVFDGGLPPGKFTLDLHTTDWGFFRGRVYDDASTGMSEPGEIFGWRTGNVILFLKRMPFRYARKIDPQTRQAGELTPHENRRHPAILYTGRWNEQRNQLQGRWRFLMPGRVPGTWFAARA